MTDISKEMREIQSESAEWMAHKSLIAIVEDGADFVVVQHAADGSTFPRITYPTKRAAAARVLQLLKIGPVAPQSHPERVCIGSISTEADDD